MTTTHAPQPGPSVSMITETATDSALAELEAVSARMRCERRRVEALVDRAVRRFAGRVPELAVDIALLEDQQLCELIAAIVQMVDAGGG